MDPARIDAVKCLLEKNGIDALLLRLPENMVMASGAWPLNGLGFSLFTVDEGPHTLIVPESERGEVDSFWGTEIKYFRMPIMGPFDPWHEVQRLLADSFSTLRLSGARVGYEERITSLAPAPNSAEITLPAPLRSEVLHALAPGRQFIPVGEIIRILRSRKTNAEIGRLRTANEIASLGLVEFANRVVLGAPEAELASAVYSACLTLGAERSGVRSLNVYPQVSAGANSARAWGPIVQTGAKRLKGGELALLELAVCVDGYWADATRVRTAGSPTDEHLRAHATIIRAQEAAFATIHSGVAAAEVHERATNVLRDEGYSHEIRHLTGHGVGFSYHEPEPMLWEENLTPLAAGNVCSVEPGLYGETWGIRIEDNVLMTEDGCEVLTLARKALI